MSVINQMLKDLETRSKTSAQPEAVINGLQSTRLTGKNVKRTIWLILGLVAFIGVWSWNLGHYYFSRHGVVQAEKKQSNTISASIPATSVATADVPVATLPQIPAPSGISGNTGVNASASANARVPAVSTANVPDFAAVTGVSMQVHGKMTFLRFMLDREVNYQVNSDPVMHSIILHVKNARLSVNIPPIDFAGSALSNIKIYPEENNGLNIILMLQTDAKLSNLELNKESKFPELQADFLLENFAAKQDNRLQAEKPKETANAVLKKVAVELTVDEQYQEALTLMEAGETDKAILKLSLLLDRHSDYHAARSSLINLYMQQGDQAKAERLLTVGLQKAPNDPDLVEAKAHILVNQGKINQALNLLKKAPPALSTNPEYYAFIAALYQRVGHLAAAESLYQQLTAQHPDKGVWWLGLGITEDGLGKNSQALEAYAKAGSSLDLDPELRGYVETKLRG